MSAALPYTDDFTLPPLCRLVANAHDPRAWHPTNRCTSDGRPIMTGPTGVAYVWAFGRVSTPEAYEILAARRGAVPRPVRGRMFALLIALALGVPK